MPKPTRSVRCLQDDQRARFFAEQKLQTHFSDPMIGLIVECDGQTVGAVILNGYIIGQNINVTVVGRCWPLHVIRDIARYCFARVHRVTAKTTMTNERAVRALKTLGFKQEGVLRDYFPQGDAVVFGLLKSEQKIVRL